MVGPFLHRKQFPHLHSLQVSRIQAPVKYNNKTCSKKFKEVQRSINHVEELPRGIEKVILNSTHFTEITTGNFKCG